MRGGWTGSRRCLTSKRYLYDLLVIAKYKSVESSLIVFILPNLLDHMTDARALLELKKRASPDASSGVWANSMWV
jgi:hypothetical protein